jgi:hypothetical protein
MKTEKDESDMAKILMECWTETKAHMGRRESRIVARYQGEWAKVTVETEFFPDANRALHEARSIANAICPGWGDLLDEQHEAQRDT